MKKILSWFVLTFLLPGCFVLGQAGLKISGDLRLRHQAVHEENEDTRIRERMRVRCRVRANVSENMDLVIGLASGPSDVDPATRNQTLTQGFSAKPVWLDLAYFDWHPVWVRNFSVIGGKMPVPFLNFGKSELVWDEDVTPEGISVHYNPGTDRFGLIFNTGYFVLQERKQGKDADLIAVQGGGSARLMRDRMMLHSAVGYYNYYGTRGYDSFFDPHDSFGNSTDQRGNYTHDFNELEWLAELESKWFGLPIAIFWHIVKNTAANSSNTGWMSGFSLGECDELYSWSLLYQYRVMEKDAVIGVFTESCFAGGGTDNQGHRIEMDMQVGKGARIGLTGFLNEKDLTRKLVYRKIQADLTVKF